LVLQIRLDLFFYCSYKQLRQFVTLEVEMRRSQLALVFVLFFAILPVSLSAQQSASVPSTITPQRDPQAVAILQKAIAAAGGLQAIQAVNDFEAQGAIKYPAVLHEPVGQVKIQGRGIDQVRMDVQVPEGTRSLVLNHGEGSFKDLNSTAKVAASSGFHIGLLIFPLPAAIAALADSNADIILEGTVEVNGTSIYKIKIVRAAPVGLERVANIRQLRASEIFVDSTSFMIVRLAHPFYPQASGSSVLTREVTFGNFQQLNGVAFPHSIAEKIAGQPSWEISINWLKFNVGLTDSTFQE
jgi:hypothetical protein